jgi:hypothetical protein
METEKKKKSMLDIIWESINKTGGCCGGGGNCCGPSDETDNKTSEKEPIGNRTTEKKSE